MSYEPNRELKSEFMSAWNSVSQEMPRYYESEPGVDANFTFELDEVGQENDGHYIANSNTLTPADSLYGYFTGDIRVDTTGVLPEVYGDSFCIRFLQNDGATSAGWQTQRFNRGDDQCYSIASAAKLQQRETLRSEGDTIAPYVRILGILIEE